MIKIKIKGTELTMDEAKEIYEELGKLFGQQSSPALPGLPTYPYPSYPFPVPDVGYPVITYTTSETVTTGGVQ